MELEQYDEAADHFRQMLRLNSGDNQGNRYHLAQCLLLSGRLDELDELLNRSDYRDDFSAEWEFTKILLEYRRGGDAPDVRKHLEKAREMNPHVVPMLIGREQVPPALPSAYESGGEDEAAACVSQIASGWHATEGALDWLERVEKEARKREWARRPKPRAAKKRRR
jgi:tetratricopeptide (TPR) repeat protein